MEEKIFKLSYRLRFNFYLVNSLFVFIPLFFALAIKIALELSWFYTFIVLLVVLIAGGIAYFTQLALIIRYLKKIRGVKEVIARDDCFILNGKPVFYETINGVVFKSVRGPAFIAPSSIERFLGYFSLITSTEEITIPSWILNLDDFMRIIIEKAHLKKVSPALGGSFLKSATIFQRSEGDFYSWNRQPDYMPGAEDFNLRASYTGGFFKLLFAVIVGVVLVYIIAMLAIRFGLV
jgi:hypothetical protein